MKNVLRMLVLTLVLTAAGFAQGMSFSGPGQIPDFPPRVTA
jgi:hypothetical protein